MRFNKHIIFLYILFSFTPIFSQSNNKYNDLIQGNVADLASKEPIAFASIYFHELGTGITTDIDGKFHFSTSYKGHIKLTVSYVGYQKLDTIITLPQRGILNLNLKRLNYALNEVVVSSQESTYGNSTSLIEKTAMAHIQPSSFADILQLLPGRSSSESNLSQPNYISMRQAGADLNTSLGTAFVVDGVQINNDANMQNFYGVSSASDLSPYLTSSKGTDMRTISTDKIESVEIVRGIPSAQYGDLTSGLVKIELKSGETPFEGRIKADQKNKLFSIGKGIALPQANGVLNIDVDYMKFETDPRSDLITYTRTTAATRYENTLKLSDNLDWLIKGNISYTGSFDKLKTDPDSQTKDEKIESDFNNIALSTKGTFKFKKGFVKNLSYDFSYTQTWDKINQIKHVSTGGVSPLTTASMEEGLYETSYLPTQYLTKLVIDGKPINFKASINAKSNLKHGNFFHALHYGLNYTYSVNKGKGEQYDLNLPPYVGTKSTRPRPYSDIPALKNLAFFVEDNLSVHFGNHNLLIQPGIRGTNMLGLDDKYKMQGKFYWEPRVNMRLTFPQFRIAEHNSSLAITAGAGQFYKMPTMAQLYPDKLYFDYTELNYYSTNYPQYNQIWVRTFIEDRINYELEPVKNLKLEAGLIFKLGQMKLDVTFFREMMKNGFASNYAYAMHNYNYYDAESAPYPPSSKPSLNDFTYSNENITATYSYTKNTAKTFKTGIEYTLDIGQIKPIYTKIWVNGAWFRTHYDTNDNRYYKPSAIYNERPYPYIGVYDYSSSDEVRSQFNTNIYFDTHIPFLRMVFTTSIQTMWYTMSKTDYNDGIPYAYIDEYGNWHEFTADMADQPIFKNLVDSHNDYFFSTNRTALASRLNLKLSKEIGDNLKLACFFNNILSYMPDYTSYTGITITNRTKATGERPYFGAEINIIF